MAIFISPEAIFLLLSVMVIVYRPELLSDLGTKLKSDSNAWKYLPTLTLLFSGAALRLSSKLRAPLENSSNKVLYNWPLYHFLVDRVIVSIGLSILCGLIGLSLWVFGKDLSGEAVGEMFVISTGMSAITALTMLLAHQKIRELIEKY